MYVNLEPCSHHGKTPPCTDQVIKSGIKRLVVGMIDPNPKVAGSGIKKIKEAGIQIASGVLEEDCKRLNEIFIKHITQNKPFLAVKTAITIDGKIASRTLSSKWITSERAREEVQRLRNKYDAVLTGSGTVMADDPSLTCRMKGGRNPVRVVIDSMLKTSPRSRVYIDDGTRVILAVSEPANMDKLVKYPDNVEILSCPSGENSKIDLIYLQYALHKKEIYSIMAESGGILNGALLKACLIDKFYFFMAPKIIGDNMAKSFIEGFEINDINDSIKLEFGSIKELSPDIMFQGYTLR